MRLRRLSPVLGALSPISTRSGDLNRLAMTVAAKPQATDPVFGAAPPPPLNDANDVVKTTMYVRQARAGGQGDDWILARLRNAGYGLDAIDRGFRLNSGYRGSQPEVFKSTILAESDRARTAAASAEELVDVPSRNPIEKSKLPMIALGIGAIVVVALIVR